MATNRESKVEDHATHLAEMGGGVSRKWVCPSRAHVPDRILVMDGDVVFCEAKTVDGVAKGGQIREAIRLARAGAKACFVYGTDGVDAMMNHVKVNRRVPGTWKENRVHVFGDVPASELKKFKEYDEVICVSIIPN